VRGLSNEANFDSDVAGSGEYPEGEDEEETKGLSSQEFKRLFRRKAEARLFRATLAQVAQKLGHKGKCMDYPGQQQYYGCSPLDASIPPCECGWAETCKAWDNWASRSDGTYQGVLDLQLAKTLFAGQCYTQKRVHYVGCLLVLLLAMSIQIYEYRHRFIFATEEEEEDDRGRSRSVASTISRAEEHEAEKEDHRQDLFEQILNDCVSPAQVLHKISRLAPEGHDWSPIIGNVYRFWAFGCRKPSLLDVISIRMVVIIQILAPITLLYWTGRRIDWARSDVELLKFIPGSYTHGLNHVFSIFLELFFIWCIALKCIKTLRSSLDEDVRLHLLFTDLSKRYSDPGILSRSRFWLLIDRFVEAYINISCLMAMLLLTVMAENPKDVVYDAFGVLFLFNLHRVSGDLAFIGEEDFDSRMIGELAARVGIKRGDLNTDCSIRTGSEADDLRQSRAYLIAELLILQIMVFAPVWMLCIVDGVVRKLPEESPRLWDPSMLDSLNVAAKLGRSARSR